LYNPWRNPQYALDRRNVVLKLMLDHQMIGDELYEMLSKRPLGVQAKGQISRKYPAFIQTLQADLRRQLGENKTSALLGARIFSTMDLKQQEQAENAVVNTVNQLQVQTKNPYLEGAMIVADYHLGEIRAVVGGLQTEYAGFNRALMSKRQIGSLVTPSIYLTALMNPEQFRLNTPIQNQPITIYVKGSQPWQPRNYDRKYSGSVMLMDALARSLNIPTVNIGMKVGLSKVIDTQKAMGWDNVAIPKVPATLLGSYSISPYDVTKLYQTIANQGGKIELSTIQSIADRQGNIIYEHNTVPDQVVPREAAYQTLYAMQQTVERGTARSLQNDYADLRLAGKTGTTNDARDTWFVGIDGKNVSTIWLGRDDNGETKLTGASGALQIYKDYLNRVVIEKLKLGQPSTIKWVGINAYGSWSCGSSRTIPVWINKDQNFCASAPTTSTATATAAQTTQSPQPEQPESAKQESVWDVLDNKAPVEEAAPAQ
ncbi:MAG: penicillin-binding transpeptidase domain-containing protein, partial [Haemophilus parainfluenzae]|nr:penicillin-binding transpeptidase domain-containing protein [Haemophilus parainfluenzae]